MWDIFSWLNYNDSAVTAIATIALVLVTILYVYLTNSLLKEQIVARKIQAIEIKLQCFYIPLLQHILLHQYPNSDKADEFYKEFNNNTVYKDFMKYIYLCKDKEVRSDLEKLLNERERLKLQDGLIKHRGVIESDINYLVEELEKLQSLNTKKPGK